MQPILFHKNTLLSSTKEGADLTPFSKSTVQQVYGFHTSFDEYTVTPLLSLPHMAQRLGVQSICIKDEAKRFGLNAFKVLGGSYAIGKILAKRLNMPIEKLGRTTLGSDAIRQQLGDITFTTATDGNHGRSIAWTAQQLGLKAVVYMPKGSAPIRAENIRATGAECYITDLNYDDTVRLANEKAIKNDWIMVQDTAWEGYEEIPRWIMQGYMTLAKETLEQMATQGIGLPTHVFLQAGVGSFAGAVLGFLVAELGDKCPAAIIVEPHQANCIYKSITIADGQPHSVTGNLQTLMAGLACGEPSSISWGVLRDYAVASLSCADFLAANGMRLLAAPQGDDPRITAGESGCAGLGALDYMIQRPQAYNKTLTELGITHNSKILFISTEGDTSPQTYNDVVLYGKCPSEG